MLHLYTPKMQPDKCDKSGGRFQLSGASSGGMGYGCFWVERLIQLRLMFSVEGMHRCP